MKKDEDPEAQKSVLESVAEKAGDTPNVMLPESDSLIGANPVVDTKSVDVTVLPKGRGNYQLLGEIARGGMGIVLKGRDTDLGRDVALKVLDPKLAERPEILRRFVEEAQIGGQLQHPGVVPVYELGLMSDERPYFTMKLVKGQTLAALLAEREAPREDLVRFLDVFHAVCQTVAYAHSKGVIHRDLKPANVMVGAFGEVQVVDWGLAKVLARDGEATPTSTGDSGFSAIETVRSADEDGSRSLAGSVMGTPAYMPPEQARGEVDALDERADVFALGAILCEILTGRPPYDSVDGAGRDVVRQAAEAELAPALERIDGTGADPDVVKLCRACLAAAPAARPHDASAVAARIHLYLVSSEERAREARVRAVEERRRRRLSLVFAGTVVIGVVAIGAILLQGAGARADRLAETRRLFDAEHDRALALQEEGLYEDALAMAEAAVRVVDVGEADDALRVRAQDLVTRLEARFDEERARALHERRNAEFVERLESLRVRETDTLGGALSGPELDAEFLGAFHEYGIDLEAEDVSPALEAMAASGIAGVFASALDQMALYRREWSGLDPWQSKRLLLMANDLDPHPAAVRMRRAMIDADTEALLALAREDSTLLLSPETLWVLTGALWGAGRTRAAHVLGAKALELHPQDFFLNMAMSHTSIQQGRLELAARYGAAARAVRPDNGYIHVDLGRIHQLIGELPSAVRSLRTAARLEPEWSSPYGYLGDVLFWLGDLEGFVAARRAEIERGEPSPAIEEELLAGRYALGEADLDEVRAWIGRRAQIVEPLKDRRRTAVPGPPLLALVLADVSDPARREPELARDLAEATVATFDRDPFAWFVLARCELQLGHVDAALAACDGADGRTPATGLLLSAMVAYTRCRALAEREDESAATHAFERAEERLGRIWLDHPEEWTRSVPLRLRQEAADRLGR